MVMGLALFFGYPLKFLKGRKRAFLFWRYLSIAIGFISDKIGGIKCVVENEKNILKEPAIYAIRHESTWETLVLISKFKEPIFVLKEELLKIPLFGALSKKVGTIAVDRENGTRSLMEAVGKVQAAVAAGHPVIIFPEGTRMAHGECVPLKRGIALFYKKAGCPVVPVVHNSGKFWPRRGFVKKSGVVTVKFLAPIAPGLSKDEFMDKLNDAFSSELKKLEG
jgi:1-acyl-sn-glycerol-3-phosphate acyltransferase